MDFFSTITKRDFKPEILPGPAKESTKRRLQEQYASLPKNSSTRQQGTDYVEVFRAREESTLQLEEECSNELTEIDAGTSYVGCNEVRDLTDDRVYDKYNFDYSEKSPLPIDLHKERIIKMIDAYKTVIIRGALGCGKTTRVPQFILDSCKEMRTNCKIVVTQPRRIAAVSVAQRVSKERNWPLGTLIGYQIGQKKNLGVDTRIIYCTTGVLLERLIHTKSLGDYTHIILDEIHERNQDMDFLLAVIKKLSMYPSSGNVRIILMSATIDTTKFANYFSYKFRNKSEPTPVIEIDGFVGGESNYMVNKFYLDQLKDHIFPLPEVCLDEPHISDEGYKTVIALLCAFDKIDEMEKIKDGLKTSVLIFMPGLYEIEQLYELLQNFNAHQNKQPKEYLWWIRVLHSSITSEEQESVFTTAPDNYRKIILSTNIAESSITIPDIKYVIDFCLTKELYCDTATNYTSLKMCWASQNSCVQRAGRVGRVNNGRVYRLVPKQFFDSLPKESRPEILRCPLDKLILHTKVLNMGEPRAILSMTMDSPDISNIDSTILSLKEVGALLVTCDGMYNEHDGDITFLGHVICSLPLDTRVAKMVFLGHVFGVLDETIIMASAMSGKNLFSTPFKEYLNAYSSKLKWADSSYSDPNAFLNAYQVWRKNRTDGSFSYSARLDEKEWAKQNYIQLKTLGEICTIETEIRDRLSGHGIQVSPHTKQSSDMMSLVLKVVIAGAFYPNYFVRSSLGGQVDEREAIKILGGNDPFSTVYLRGMLHHQPGILYSNKIKKALSDISDNIDISFDNSAKVYVHCKSRKTTQTDIINGKISFDVYKAVKLRQLKNACVSIDVLPPKEAFAKFEELKKQKLYSSDLKEDDMLPWSWKKTSLYSNIRYMKIRVCYILDPEHFCAQSDDQIPQDLLSEFYDKLNNFNALVPIRNERDIQVGKLYAGAFVDESKERLYYRCRVTKISGKAGKRAYSVYFVDYGNVDTLGINDLRAFGPELLKLKYDKICGLAIECTLAEVKPASFNNVKERWSAEAINKFDKLVTGKTIIADVYSFIANVASLILYDETTGNPKDSINQCLINLKYADPAEESRLSKEDHDLRELNYGSDNDVVLGNTKGDIRISSTDYEIPEIEGGRISVTLTGPYSPLEMRVYGLKQSARNKFVNIETNSVNSVLLDTHPHDPHERLLVAGFVGTNPTGNTLILRDTTLMPNLHGFSSLLCLLFAPKVELRSNKGLSRFSGALCGLGWNPNTKKPHFPENDMEIVFDCNFDVKSLTQINTIRSLLNEAMVDFKRIEPDNASIIQKLIYELSHTLHISDGQGNESFERPFEWGLIPKAQLLQPFLSQSNYGPYEYTPAIYNLIWCWKLNEEKRIPTLEYQKNVRIINDVVNGRLDMPDGGVTCILCNTSYDDVQSLRIHIKQTRHKQRETLYRRQNHSISHPK